MDEDLFVVLMMVVEVVGVVDNGETEGDFREGDKTGMVASIALRSRLLTGSLSIICNVGQSVSKRRRRLLIGEEMGVRFR